MGEGGGRGRECEGKYIIFYVTFLWIPHLLY